MNIWRQLIGGNWPNLIPPHSGLGSLIHSHRWREKEQGRTHQYSHKNQRRFLLPSQCSDRYGIPSQMGISSMQRSSLSLDVLANPGGWTRQKLFSSILMFWQPHAVTSSPVRSPSLLQKCPVTAPTAFGFSDGIQTRLNAGLPSDVEPFFDLEECDLDGDFGDPVEGEPVDLQSQTSPDASMLQRSIKTYIVKYTAHRTLVSESHEVCMPLTSRWCTAYTRSSGTSIREKLLSPDPVVPKTSPAPLPNPFIGLRMRFAVYANAIPVSISKSVAAQDGSSQVTSIPGNCGLHRSTIAIRVRRGSVQRFHFSARATHLIHPPTF